MSTMTPETLLETYYYQGLNKGENGEAVVRDIVEEQVKFRGVFGHRSRRGVNYLLDYMRAARRALGKYTFEIEEMIVSKDNTKASIRFTCRGTHRNDFFGVQGSGHEVHFTSAGFFLFSQTDKLRIAEVFIVGDLDELKRQIGAETSSANAFPVPTSITTTTTTTTEPSTTTTTPNVVAS